MVRIVLSCCSILIACGGAAAQTPPAPSKAAPAAPCSTPEVVFHNFTPVPGYAAPHNTEMPLQPRYPAALGANGPSGTVWEDFIVERDGRLCHVVVKSIDGPQQFVDLTTAWLNAASFAPAKKSGIPVVSEVKRTLDFIPLSKRQPVLPDHSLRLPLRDTNPH